MNRLLRGCAMVSLILIAAACGGSDAEETAQPVEESGDAAPYEGVSRDGVTLTWEYTEDVVSFTMSAPSSGWVAVGFDASSAMLDGDIIIGFVLDGELFISDQWGDGYTSHSADTELGGSYDILSAEGSESDGVTSISFTRPISTSDDYDHVLEQGTSHKVLLAYGPQGSDSFEGRHEWVETFQVELD